MGKIMVTGALGNVGGYVAQYAILNGQQVKVVGPHPEALAAQYNDKAESVLFDLVMWRYRIVFYADKRQKGHQPYTTLTF